ncbi:MAG: MFS transporter [Rhodospirillaceae bacterium]|nr:MFS transporter [Rhodospirillaceae bacterium]
MNTVPVGRTASSALSWPSPVYAWYVMTILVIAYSFAILDRSIISLLVQPIKQDLGVTDAQIGLLQGLAFAICFSTFGLVMGVITDRTDRRALLAGGIFVWSIATAACGLSDSFTELFISRIFVGLGEACVMPVSGSLIADYLPPKSRAKAYGILLLGGSIGTAAGGILGGNAIAIADAARGFGPAWVEGLRNWQIVFLAVGLPGVLVALWFGLTVREPARREKAEIVDRSLKPLIEHARLNWFAYTTLMISAILNVMCIYAQIAWVPTFIIRVYAWPPEDVGWLLGATAITGAGSSITVGWFMSWLIAKGRDDASMIAIAVHGLFCMVFGTLTCLVPGSTLMMMMLFCKSFTSNWSSSALLMGLSQITPNEQRGQIIAIYTLVNGLIALTAGGYIIGLLSDNVFTEPTGIRYSLTTIFAGGGGLAMLLVFAGRPAFRAAAERARAWVEKA